MTVVELRLPEDVLASAGLASDSRLGGDGVVRIILEGVDIVVAVTTAGAVLAQLPALATALRHWVLRNSRPIKLILKGRKVETTMELSPNVSSAQVTRAIRTLLDLERND